MNVIFVLKIANDFSPELTQYFGNSVNSLAVYTGDDRIHANFRVSLEKTIFRHIIRNLAELR